VVLRGVGPICGTRMGGRAKQTYGLAFPRRCVQTAAGHMLEAGAMMGPGQREQGRLRVGDNQMPPPFG